MNEYPHGVAARVDETTAHGTNLSVGALPATFDATSPTWAAPATGDSHEIRARKIWKKIPDLESIFGIRFGRAPNAALWNCQNRDARARIEDMKMEDRDAGSH